MRREDGDDPPKPEDLVTFDTAPAMEEKRQHPRAINIAVLPSGVAASSQRLDPFGVILAFPEKLGGPVALCQGELGSGSYVSPTSLRG